MVRTDPSSVTRLEREIDELQWRLQELKRSEEKLAASEERYRSLFETAMVGLYRTRIDDGQMLEASQALVDLMGYDSREEFLQGFRTSEHYEVPEQRAELLRLLRERGKVDWFEINATRRDGGGVPIAVSAIIYPERGVLEGVVIDLTERKRAEEALRESQERYRDLVETIEDWIWEVDAHGLYTYVSPRVREHLGFEPRELLGKKLFELMPQDEASRVEKLFRHLAANRERIVNLENRNIHKDGHEIVMETNGVPYFASDGTLLGYRGVDRNITERKRAEEERRKLDANLQHTQKLESLGLLAGGIAHDFNNLLVAILGNADLALSALPHDVPGRNYIEGIGKAAHRAAGLCNQMLAYAGKESLTVKPIQISEIVEEIAGILKVSISKKATIEYDFADALPAVDADAAQIHQVIMNLMTNASEAVGDREGFISLRTGVCECSRSRLDGTVLGRNIPPGRYVFVEVSDTGEGVDEERLEKIFQPFYTTKFMGRGLGLSATLGIVRGHRGTIEVTSRPGMGSKFRVYLPISKRPVVAPVTRDRELDDPLPDGTVLLVDDEEAVRQVACEMLSTLGFGVLSASNGREAIETLKQRADDIKCVLLDLTMPGMGGEETLQEMRAVVPVFIQKPYRIRELRAVLTEVFRNETEE
jgi:PAS domain S-box-containing protein